MSDWLAKVAKDFITCFITKDRWKYIVKGLGNTLQIALVAVLLGILIGTIVAIIRSTHDKTHETMRPGVGRVLLNIADWLCKVYLTVIRGTPVVVQLMISYFLIFVSAQNGVLVGIFAFGINSGAYVAEIFRGGIESIPRGQYEAAAALGMTKAQTFFRIILPQVIKRIVPASSNEVITLVKDTSLANVVAYSEIMLAAKQQMMNYSSLVPLFIAGVFYFVMATVLTALFGFIEKKLNYYR